MRESWFEIFMQIIVTIVTLVLTLFLVLLFGLFVYTVFFASPTIKDYNYTIKTVEDRRVLIVDDDGKFQAIDLGKADVEAQ